MITTPATTTAAPSLRPWLFSGPVDVATFGGGFVLTLVLIGVAVAEGVVVPGQAASSTASPEWVWVSTILLIDVAHVWGSAVLIYLDPAERRRRPLLYGLVPVAVFVLGAAVASESELWLWRLLAYVAVWHFARQQVGFVRLYRGRAGETGRLGQIVDEGAVYASTLGPIVWWHSRLPTSIAWFADGDFVAGLPRVVGDAALVLMGALLLAYGVRAVGAAHQRRQLGKHLLVGTTALLWSGGIVMQPDDTVFTLTNVIGHGVPYIVLVVWTGRRRLRLGLSVATVVRAGMLAIVATLWALAFAEELLWDRLLHHERGWLFPGPEVDVDVLRPIVVALLCVPQVTHYVLDGFYWKRRTNPTLSA